MKDSNDRIVRLRTVLDRTGLSRSTLYRKIAEGKRKATMEPRGKLTERAMGASPSGRI